MDADRDVDAWEDAGLYEPAAPGAEERLALLDYLVARGATVEQMVEAHRLGSLPAVAGDLALGGRPATVDIARLAERSGTTVERLERILLAVGLPVTADSQVPENLDTLVGAFDVGASMMGEDAILAFTRVLGASATNIAEAAVALFYAELGPGTPREGSDEVARAQVSEASTLAFTAVPEAMARLVMEQFERANRRAMVARGWYAAEGPTDGLDGASPAEPSTSEVVTLGFVDLVGSTAWAESLSLREQSLALARFESAAWSSAVLAGGRVVKMIGDEVFFAAPSVQAGCRIALEVCDAAGADAVLPSARGAVGRGPVTPREGDYFGPLVNVVSRLVKAADPGAVVATGDAAAALPTADWHLQPLEPQPLRGVEHPVTAFAITPR